MIMFEETKEPPIGVKPYYVALSERINDLAKAIEQYSASGNPIIELWAKEIILLSKTVAKLKSGDPSNLAEETTI